MIKLPNETSIYIQDEESRQCYLYDYYLQFAVSVVNAKTLKKMLGESKKKSRRRRNKPVATVFFRFSHRDHEGKSITNQAQSGIVDVIRNFIESK
jgi:hypothetical protein